MDANVEQRSAPSEVVIRKLTSQVMLGGPLI
jgi:hypothetical protein